MFKVIKESFKLTNENIIIATPLILFSLISTLYLIFSSGGNKIGLLFSVILFFLMLGAFLSGWFYMIARVIKNPDNNGNKLITEFPSGVGEYFVVTLVMIFKILLISAIIIIIAFLAGKKFIGGIGIPYSQLSSSISNVEDMKALIDSMSREQLIKINAWNLLIFFSMLFNYFILLFYPAVIFFKRKNPFIAFWISLKDTFGRKFFKNVGLFLLIMILYMIISSLMALFGKNMFIHFTLTLINFYYATFVGILVFNYYYTNFAKIGSAIDTRV